ncbi:MAG TPA: hypothetical protein VF532_20050 [Candidatus Angelobacter sp.]
MSHSIRGLIPQLASACLALLLASCAGSAKSNPTAPGQTGAAGISVTISPSATSISAGGTQTFVATVSGNSNTAVTWKASSGSISGTGNTITYTAPAVAGSYTVTATSMADSSKSASAAVTVSTTGGANSCSGIALGEEASLNGFRPFPATNPWNQDISVAPVDANSATIISFIGNTVGLHADFGSGTLGGSTIGIPYVVVDSTQQLVSVNVGQFAGESDVVPMRLPATAPIEGAPNPGDNHVLLLDKSNCWLYELYQGALTAGQWSATGSAVWDLETYNDRPYTWTSADAAGLPIFPGLVRFDEVAAGAINHAIRFTVPGTKSAFVSPATHWAGTNSSSPIPMGLRLRLKSTFDVSKFSAANQVILNAMKKYGLLLADNGSAMFLSGAPDSRWDNNDLHLLGTVTASNFEVVQMPAAITSTNVPAGAAPTIASFTASSLNVTAGTAVALTWQASGASYYLVNPQIGPVRGNSVTANPSATTTYTLTATNAFGRKTASVTITVH